jgi:hypothetical protein
MTALMMAQLLAEALLTLLTTEAIIWATLY